MKTIEVKFDVGDSVVVEAICASGVVLSVAKQFFGIRYEVAYWMDGKRFQEYLFDHEIKAK